jgi:hypothetical protein
VRKYCAGQSVAYAVSAIGQRPGESEVCACQFAHNTTPQRLALALAYPVNGFTKTTPNALKSAVFRVTSVKPRVLAMAAIVASSDKTLDFLRSSRAHDRKTNAWFGGTAEPMLALSKNICTHS